MNQFKLVSGVGNYDSGTACILSAAVAKVRLSRGEPIGKETDELECACPVLRRALIVVNDADWWVSDEERTEVLTPWIDCLIDSKTSSEVEKKRMFFLADKAVRVFAPIALKAAGLLEEAARLESLCEVDSKGASTVAAGAGAAAYAAARAASAFDAGAAAAAGASAAVAGASAAVAAASAAAAAAARAASAFDAAASAAVAGAGAAASAGAAATAAARAARAAADASDAAVAAAVAAVAATEVRTRFLACLKEMLEIQ